MLHPYDPWYNLIFFAKFQIVWATGWAETQLSQIFIIFQLLQISTIIGPIMLYTNQHNIILRNSMENYHQSQDHQFAQP